MVKIVALDGYTLNPGDLSWDSIGVHGALEVFNRSTLDQGIERAQGAEILIVNKFVISREFLSHCDDLRLLCVSATGYNNVDIEACKEKNIRVCNVANYSTTGVAQHTFALLLYWMNLIGRHNNLVKKGFWSICPDFSFTESPINELAGKKFGILGYGDIAKRVAQIALAFEMEVLVTRKSSKTIDNPLIKTVELNTLFSESDILSLHASLNEETKEIVNKNTLSMMKESAILINTSRGGLINENDLAEHLSEEKIQAALLDVLVEEPAPLHHPLYSLTNCKITPHIAWASVESRTRLMETLSNNIAAFLKGESQNVIA